MKQLIDNLNIPNKLKKILLKETSNDSNFMDEELLLEIEHLYHYYSIFYNVSDEQYNANIIFLLNNKNANFSINKELKLAFSDYKPANIYKMFNNQDNQEKINKYSEKTLIEFIDVINSIIENENNINLIDVFKILGKMECVVELNPSRRYERVYDLGMETIQRKDILSRTKNIKIY